MMILNNDVSQGSVATCLRCGRIFNDDLIANLLVSDGRMLKIGQHLKKIGQECKWLLLWTPSKWTHTVFPIFGWSLASSRIIK